MAAATGPTPPLIRPGLNTGSQFSCPNISVNNAGQQEPGLQGLNQDQGPQAHPQQFFPARPIFCIPPPPLPHLVQYQWPMPLSLNPFPCFPGMGYGMVMPQFPLPSYMESPAYIVPTPHIQPVDYRRFLPQPMHPSGAPYQNPNHARRIRLPLPVRESVDFAVQTESPQRGEGGYVDGSPPVRSDSGHGTASSSPSSSSSQRQVSAEDKSVTSTGITSKDFRLTRRNEKLNHGLNFHYPTRTGHAHINTTAEAVGQEDPHPDRNCSVWSVTSPDGIIPVCSSSQQDEVIKERLASVPDILMSWGAGTPQAKVPKLSDGTPRLNEDQLPSYETEMNHLHGTENENNAVVPGSADVGDMKNISSSKDNETIFKILTLPFFSEHLPMSRTEEESVVLVGCRRRSSSHKDGLLYSLQKSQEQQHIFETNPHESTTDAIPYEISLNNGHVNVKMNESVWSVESLTPFIPTEEGLAQRGLLDSEIPNEMIDKAENVRPSSQNDNLVVKSVKERRCSRLFSSSDLEFSWPVFSTPTDQLSPRKKTQMNTENNTSEPKKSLSPLNHLTDLPSEVLSTPSEDDMDQSRSSEPEATQSPNQQSVVVNEQQERSCVSSEDEVALPLNSTGEKVLVTDQMILHDGMYREVDNGSSECEEANQQRNERLYVPVTDQHTEKSLPKGSLVDCSTQCSEILCFKCGNTNLEPSRRHFIKPLDDRDKAQAHMQKKQRRNGIQEEQSSQQRGFKGNSSKPETSTGGNGKHAQH